MNALKMKSVSLANRLESRHPVPPVKSAAEKRVRAQKSQLDEVKEWIEE
jgi:hypothetical protein